MFNKYILLKEKAIKLRKEGKTYSEILSEIKVAKSTLSLWLRDVGLAKRQIQRITQKSIQARLRGGIARREKRLKRTKEIYEEASRDIDKISKRDLFMLGIALYWAEGCKDKEYRPGTNLKFSNSDVRMIKIYLSWLKLLGFRTDLLLFDLYIHKNDEYNVEKSLDFWSKELGIERKLIRVYYKKCNPFTNRKNKNIVYNGLLQVILRSSSEMVRRVEGWVRKIHQIT